jgi:hypothetical protein
MSFLSSDLHDPSDERSRLGRALVAIALLAGFVALFAFAPPDDPTKVVSALPCSVLTENQVAAVIGTPMKLMPTSGVTCHYVPSGAGDIAVRAGTHVYTIAVVSHDAVRAAPPGAAQRLAKLVRRPMIAANR